MLQASEQNSPTPFAISSLEKSPAQQSFDLTDNSNSTEEAIELNVDLLIATIKKRKISTKKALQEMNLSYSSLLHFVKGESKRLNKDNDEKILNWLKENI